MCINLTQPADFNKQDVLSNETNIKNVLTILHLAQL